MENRHYIIVITSALLIAYCTNYQPKNNAHRSIINKTPLVCLNAMEHGPAKQVSTFIKLPDTTLSGNEYIFFLDGFFDFRTVRFISGHLATLTAGRMKG